MGNQRADQAVVIPREISLRLVKEQPVVGTRNYVAEVVRIRTKFETDQETVSGTIRKEDVEIVKLPATVAGVGGTGAALGGVATLTGSGAPSPVSAITVKGDAMCRKCKLHEGAVCETVIEARTGDQTIEYYVVQNDVSKKFNANLGKQAIPVTASGVARESEGKHWLTLSSIVAQNYIQRLK